MKRQGVDAGDAAQIQGRFRGAGEEPSDQVGYSAREWRWADMTKTPCARRPPCSIIQSSPPALRPPARPRQSMASSTGTAGESLETQACNPPTAKNDSPHSPKTPSQGVSHCDTIWPASTMSHFQFSVTSPRYENMSHCARIWPASTMSHFQFSVTSPRYENMSHCARSQLAQCHRCHTFQLQKRVFSYDRV